MSDPRLSDRPYMDGHGVIERTRKLSDDLFDQVLPAILGTTAVFCGPFLSWGFLLSHHSWEPPPSRGHWIAAVLISAVSIIGGIAAARPWFKTSREIKEHTRRMKEETARRGRGWAKS